MSLERNNSAEIFQGIYRKIVKTGPSGWLQIALLGLSTNDFNTIFDGEILCVSSFLVNKNFLSICL